MLDFKELPQDGQAFEQLIRELLFTYGLHVQWSGRGIDGGRDLICKETLKGMFASQSWTWLVQCKHFAHSGRSVGTADLDAIVDSCAQHNATGYLLCCSTQPSSSTIERLEGVTANNDNPITAICWDAVMIERLLSTPKQWGIAQRFMPQSTGEWRLYATDKPNDFIAHYRGYVFHLTNRIGSNVEHHLPTVASRIQEIEALTLPKQHHIRPRAVWYDDKHGSYIWYVDYMFPSNQSYQISMDKVKTALNDGDVWEDGQFHSWDIQAVEYNPDSDHYDEDHYDYYLDDLPTFLQGGARHSTWEQRHLADQEIEDLEEAREKIRHPAFDAMVDEFSKFSFLSIVQANNACVEDIRYFERRFVWTSIIKDRNVNLDQIISALILIEVNDEEKFFGMMSAIPQRVETHFFVSKRYCIVPDQGLSKDIDNMYEIRLSLHPRLVTDEFSARNELNSYFDEIRAALDAHRSGDTAYDSNV